MNTHVKAIAIGAIIGGSLGYLIGKWYVDNYLLLDVDDWYFENQDTNKEEPTTCAEEDVPVVEEIDDEIIRARSLVIKIRIFF